MTGRQAQRAKRATYLRRTTEAPLAWERLAYGVETAEASSMYIDSHTPTRNREPERSVALPWVSEQFLATGGGAGGSRCDAGGDQARVLRHGEGVPPGSGGRGGAQHVRAAQQVRAAAPRHISLTSGVSNVAKKDGTSLGICLLERQGQRAPFTSEDCVGHQPSPPSVFAPAMAKRRGKSEQ